VIINKTVELENGKVEFKGELSQEELDLVLTMGLNMLLSKGAIPFTSKFSEVGPNKREFTQ